MKRSLNKIAVLFGGGLYRRISQAPDLGLFHRVEFTFVFTRQKMRACSVEVALLAEIFSERRGSLTSFNNWKPVFGDKITWIKCGEGFGGSKGVNPKSSEK